jgi:GntR family transcriptional regulator
MSDSSPMVLENEMENLIKKVDRNSPIPFYAQVMNTVKDLIERGVWKPTDQIPREIDLCVLFDVSRTVIRQAIKELTHEGLLIRKKGKGTFVAEKKITGSLVQELTGSYADMAAQGLTLISEVLEQSIITPTSKIASYLQIDSSETVIKITRLRFVKEEAIVLVTTYLPYRFCPGLENVDLRQQSLYEVLATEYNLQIETGVRTIEAIEANSEEAELLGVAEGSSLLLINSISYLTDGTPIEYYRAVHRGDRSRFQVQLVRIPNKHVETQVKATSYQPDEFPA